MFTRQTLQRHITFYIISHKNRLTEQNRHEKDNCYVIYYLNLPPVGGIPLMCWNVAKYRR